jgi:hypothetical protein
VRSAHVVAEGTIPINSPSAYTDIPGSFGPFVAVNVPASGQALVTLSATFVMDSAIHTFMSFDTTGCSGNVTAADDRSIQIFVLDSAIITASTSYLVTGLSPGNHVFIARYRVGITGGTAPFARARRRTITVIPLP